MQGAAPRAARTLVLPERPVHRVEEPQRLRGAIGEVFLVRLERQRSADVDVEEIHGRVAVDDPVGEDLASAARGLDADRVEARRHEQIVVFSRWAEEIAVVRREAFRSVEEQLHTGVSQGRIALQGLRKDRFEVVEVLGQGAEGEVVGHAVHGPGLRFEFEGTEEELACILLEVSLFVGHAQGRHAGREHGHGLGDEIEVLGRLQRYGNAGAGRELPRPHAGGEHHGAGAHLALGRADANDPPVLDQQIVNAQAFTNRRAARAGAGGQGHGRVDRIGLPVAGQANGAVNAVQGKVRPVVEDLLRRELLHLYAEGPCRGCLPEQLFHAALVQRNRDRARRAEAGRLSCPCFEIGEELRRVAGKSRQIPAGAQLGDETGRVPGGACRQLVLFEKKDVGASALRQVIGDGAADDASTDDDDFNCIRHSVRHDRAPPQGRPRQWPCPSRTKDRPVWRSAAFARCAFCSFTVGLRVRWCLRRSRVVRARQESGGGARGEGVAER